jgi:hypothetical protein
MGLDVQTISRNSAHNAGAMRDDIAHDAPRRPGLSARSSREPSMTDLNVQNERQRAEHEKRLARRQGQPPTTFEQHVALVKQTLRRPYSLDALLAGGRGPHSGATPAPSDADAARA